MKHIGWCIDQIFKEMEHMPKDVTSQEKRDEASSKLDKVEKFIGTLIELIHHPKFREHVKRLENAPFEELKTQGHEIEELAKNLETGLYLLDQHIKNLRDILANHPDQWEKEFRREAEELVFMLAHKFCGDRGELHKELEIATHTEEELRELVSSEEHLEAFLK